MGSQVTILTRKLVNFKYIPEWLTETSDSTFEGLGEMFEGHSADTRAGKFPQVNVFWEDQSHPNGTDPS
jgi:hypothetical protein